jgi:hypothetical protein
MEAWRVWLRRQKTVSPKYHKVQFSCRPRLTRVSSDRRNMIGLEPSWGGKWPARIHTKEGKKRRHREGGVGPRICREKEDSMRETPVHRRTMRLNCFDFMREEETSEMRAVSLMLRKHLINLAEGEREREYMRNCKIFPSDIMAWYRGG